MRQERNLHYRKLQEILRAKALADRFQNIRPTVIRENALPYDLRGRTDVIQVHGHGYPVLYLPHEIRILPATNSSYASEALSARASYPDGVGYLAYTGPAKEYVHFMRDGQRHYFVIPPEGLRLRPVGKGEFRVMNYRPDCNISISRKKANEARAKHAGFFEYFDAMWGMADLQSEAERFSWQGIDDPDKWYGIVLSLKSAYRYGYGQQLFDKDGARRAVFDGLPWLEMAYNVEPVPTTETAHSRHWEEYKRLAEAGLIDAEPRKF